MTKRYLLNDTVNLARPVALNGIERDTAAVGFTMISDTRPGLYFAHLQLRSPGALSLSWGLEQAHRRPGFLMEWTLLRHCIRSTTTQNMSRSLSGISGMTAVLPFNVEDGSSFLRTSRTLSCVRSDRAESELSYKFNGS